MNRTHLDALRERLGSSLWVLPSAAVVTALVAGTVLARVDAPDDSLVARLVFGGGPEGARAVLQVVAGSVMTVTSVTFSLTVLALQNAANQYSPRVLSTFMRDRAQQVVLAVFLATFAYCVVVLRTVRTGDGDATAVVPDVAVTVAVLLALASLAALVYFIHHVTQTLRVEAVLTEVTQATMAAIEARDARQDDGERVEAPLPDVPAWATPVIARASGVLQAVNAARLRSFATRERVVVRLVRAPGEHVTRGTAVGHAWPADADGQMPDAEALARQVGTTLQLGEERTLNQDVGYGIRQLTDVALRAISPGMNDPTTAVDALGRLSTVLGRLAPMPLGPRLLVDDHGLPRVWIPSPSFPDLLDAVVEQVLTYGAQDHTVLSALADLLGDVGALSGEEPRRTAVRRRLDEVVKASAQLRSDHARALVRGAADRARDRIAGVGSPAAGQRGTSL